MPNSSVLVISDTHIPYHHPDLFDFLSDIKRTYKPDRVIHIGDEVDNHAMSYHDSDPDLRSAGDELSVAKGYIKQMEKLFPKMDLLESNHGSLYFRKAKTHGIPRSAMKSYSELLGVKNWKWHFDLTIRLSDGQPVYFHHGKNKDSLKLSKNMGMSAVQGHYHSEFNIKYWGNPERLNWGMNVGCLIDDESYAMAYNKATLDRPIIGLGVILEGQPMLIPMVKKRNGRWNGKLV